MQTTLAGRCGIVTDAISAVGRTIALELARDGTRLALGYRAYRGADFEAVEQLVRELVRVGGEAVPMRLPVDNIADLERSLGSLVDLWGWLDFVVDMTSDCSVGRAALPWLLERGRGRIVFIASPVAASVLYSKADLRALAARGIAINTIHIDRVPAAQPLTVAASTEFLLAQDCCLTGQVLDLGGDRQPTAGSGRRGAPYTLQHNMCSAVAVQHLSVLRPRG